MSSEKNKVLEILDGKIRVGKLLGESEVCPLNLTIKYNPESHMYRIYIWFKTEDNKLYSMTNIGDFVQVADGADMTSCRWATEKEMLELMLK